MFVIVYLSQFINHWRSKINKTIFVYMKFSMHAFLRSWSELQVYVNLI